jgi:UDPglucose 6-dehydrogenase
LRLIDRLLSEGAEIVVYDPLAAGNARKLLGIRISYSQSARQALDKSDCCFLVTEWNEFRKLNPGDFERMRTRVIIDGRRVLNSSTFGATDSYEAIGLGPR